jgi:hypothetical protein
MRARADTGTFSPGGFEEQYEQLFAEALHAGGIGPEERQRLDLAAAALGIDPARVQALEAALYAAYQAKSAIGNATPISQPNALVASAYAARPSTQPPPAPVFTPTTGVPAMPSPRPAGLPVQRTERPDSDDALHVKFERCRRFGHRDEQLCAAAVLVRRGVATADELQFFEAHRALAPTRPSAPMTVESWADLFHPEADRDIGDIFAAVASAVLIGRISAMRRDKVLPKLDAKMKQDPATTTVSAVRALAWSAAVLGLEAPPMYLAPDRDAGLEIIVAVPPATRIGARMLAGKSTHELAFHSARHLTWFRAEHFVCALVPSVQYLEDVFVAALSLCTQGLDLSPDARERVRIVADAIRPVLDAQRMDALRSAVARFLHRGGRSSLRRWARAAELTSCRAGLLLCGDLQTACDALATDAGAPERVADLEAFWTSDAASRLRRHLGLALP